MEVKYCVILLLWFAGFRRGECEFTRVMHFAGVTHFVNRNEETYSVFVAHFKNTSEVGFFACGKFAGFTDTKEEGQFVCNRLADFTNTSPNHYVGCITHFTDSKGDSWLVRITAASSKSKNEIGWFVCRRLSASIENCADDYFVFVKNLSKTGEIGWFLCQRARRANYENQCSGDGYCVV